MGCDLWGVTSLVYGGGIHPCVVGLRGDVTGGAIPVLELGVLFLECDPRI